MSDDNYTSHRWGVAMGSVAAQQQPVWLLDGLIEMGDQWMLAGSPKAGKSMMATQLGLAVSSGGKFMSWQCSRPARVLYMDFELKDRVFWQRVLTMYNGNELAMKANKRFFRCGDFKTIDVLDVVERQKITEMIAELKPDLIIWDVLARMHSAEENDNGMMKAVMLSIRMMSGAAAHVVVHHARKPPSGAEGVNLGALGMRGASSIHGEADGVMSLAVRDGQGARYSLQFSTRAVETPDELLLNRGPTLLFNEASEDEQDKLKLALHGAFRGNGFVLSSDLEAHFCEALGVKSRRAKDYIKQCCENGWIAFERRQDRRFQYILLEGAPILRSVQ